MVIPKLCRSSRKERERGQSLAEFALVVPIFLILVFAIVDFGMGFHAWITVTNAAREGARLGAVQATEQQVRDRALETANTAVCASTPAVTVTGAQGTPGDSVSVEVDCQYDFITPLSGMLSFVTGGSIGPTLNFSSEAQMRLEY